MREKELDSGVRAKWPVWLIAAANVAAVSGLVRIYGLYDRFYFNKSAFSAGALFLSAVMAGKTLGDMKKDRRTAGWCLALSGLLAFTEMLGMGMRLAANDMPAVISAGSVLWMVLSAAPMAFLTEPFFFFLSEQIRERRTAGRSGSSVRRFFLKAWLWILIGYMPCFLAFFPGLYCYDMIWQWAMYAGKNFSTHHPLLHTLLSGWLLETGKRLFGSYNGGLALYALVQLCVLSGAAAFAVSFLYKIRAGRGAWLSAAAFYILFPFFPVSGVSTTKDIFFGSFFAVSFVCLCDMVMERKLYGGRKLAGFAAVSVLAGLFRNNAVYGILFTAVVLLTVRLFMRGRREEKRLVLRLGAVLLAVVLGIEAGFGALAAALHASSGSVAEMLSVPCQQLARTYVYHGEELSAEEKEELFQYIPENYLAAYTYYLSDPVKAGLQADYLEEHKAEFLRLWLEIGKQFPGEYLLAPVYNTFGIWYLGGDSSCYVEYRMSQPFDEAHTVETHSLIPWLNRIYSWFTDANIQKLPVVSLLFYTSFYAWAVLICAVLIVIRRQWRYLILPLFCIGYILTVLLGPCLTVRYMLNIMLCVPVLAGIVFCGMGNLRKLS